MKTLNLIIDYQNIAMRALFMCGYGDSHVSSFDTDEECAILVRKITTDIAYVVRLFSPNRIIIAADAKHPWRKDLYKPEEEGYKGTHVKDDTKNWDKIFASLDELKEIYSSKGFIVSTIQHAEADDIAGLWKNKLFNECNENIILVTSDKDWLQLVDYNSRNNVFCISFNPIASNKGKRTLSFTQECRDWIFTEEQKTDIFFTNYSSSKELLKNLQKKDAKIDFSIVNPNKVVLEKIMCGDDGDNVPAFYQYYKNGKKQRITPLKSTKILEELNVSTVDDLQMVSESQDILKITIEKYLKKELDDINVHQRLERQRKLVELNPILFPEEIQKSFKYLSEDAIKQDLLQTNNITMQEILKGTKYIDDNYKRPRKSDVFDNLKDLEKYIVNPTATNLF